MLKELLRRKPKEVKPNPTYSLNKAVKVEIDPKQHNLLLGGIQRNTFNLEDAENEGIKPLTIKQVLSQIESDLHQNLVLFDTTPSLGAGFGNHFRLKTDSEGKTKLQACSASGAWDVKGVLPFEMPENFPMFTGATLVVAYDDNGELVPLNEAQKYWQAHSDELLRGDSEIHYKGSLYMWSNPEGRIGPQLTLEF